METPDYSGHLARPTDDHFARLADMVDRLTAAKERVTRLEDDLARAQEELRLVSETELPDFMENVLGLEECKTRDGRKVEIKEAIRAGISKERTAAAMAWLRANGHGRLIKHVLKVEFDKGEDAVAKVLAERLQNEGFEADDLETVHAQTLGAWVREKLQQGALPDDAIELLGVHRQKFAKIS